MSLYPYVYKTKNSIDEQTKNYSPHIHVTCGQYKNNNKYQFTLNTEYGIKTDKDFKTPEDAFSYADKHILKVFNEVIKNIKR